MSARRVLGLAAFGFAFATACAAPEVEYYKTQVERVRETSIGKACASYFAARSARAERCSQAGEFDRGNPRVNEDAYILRCADYPLGTANPERAEIFAACAKELEHAPCDADEVDLPACEKASRGALAIHSRCIASSECASHYCDKPAVLNPRLACGWCAPSAKLGERCAPPSDAASSSSGADSSAPRGCDWGLFCDSVAGTCASVAREGEPCVPTNTGGPPCAPGLKCREGAPKVGTCVRGLRAGTPCESSEQCRVGTLCLRGRCGVFPALGTPCARTSECSPRDVCVQGACTRPPSTESVLQLGEDCDPNSIDHVCPDGAVCQAHRCVPDWGKSTYDNCGP